MEYILYPCCKHLVCNPNGHPISFQLDTAMKNTRTFWSERTKNCPLSRHTPRRSWNLLEIFCFLHMAYMMKKLCQHLNYRNLQGRNRDQGTPRRLLNLLEKLYRLDMSHTMKKLYQNLNYKNLQGKNRGLQAVAQRVA